MLRLGKKADYGLIALRHLASKPPRAACSAREIARIYGMPTELVAKILQTGEDRLACVSARY